MSENGPSPRRNIYVNPSRQNSGITHTGGAARTLHSSRNPTASDSGDSLVPRWLVKSGRVSWYLIGITLVIVGIFFATSKIIPVFIAIFVAFLFTALLKPVVDFCAKFMPRWVGVLIAIVGSFAFFAGLFTFVVTSVAGQWKYLGGQLTNGIEKILSFLESTPFHISLTTDQVYAWFNKLISQGEHYLTENWQSIAGTVLSNAGTVGVVATIVALSVFIAVFFLNSGTSMWRWFIDLLPAGLRANTNRAAQAGWMSFAGYARGTVMVSVTDGLLAWILLAVLGVPLAPALAVLVMIGAFVPMVGAPAAMLVAMIVALATDGIVKALIVGVGIALIGQFEGHILQPLIMSKQVSLSPVVVGVGVVAGAMLGGLLGAIVVIPIMGVTWAVFSALYHRDPPVVGPLPGSIVEPTDSDKHSHGAVWRLVRPNRWFKSKAKADEHPETSPAKSGEASA